jgi:ligand-binding sensor domain-containing protein|tara:strand:+ start:6738 stop:7757 length:1020 start_codon:yes stop_codon:yes gene_type:complete
MISTYKYSQLFTVIFIIVLSTSCTGQNKTDLLTSQLNSAFKYLDNSQIPSSITRAIKQDRKRNIWFASWEGIIQYNGQSFTNLTAELSSSHFFSVLEDRKGNMWFGSLGSGVYRYDGKSFQNFTTNEGLVNNRVTNIYEDKKGNIWLATEGGASCYDGKSFRNFTTKEGLAHNDINTIIEDDTGRFWFGTRGDACFYNGKTFTTITNNQGISFENVRHMMKDKEGGIWLGGNDGLWRYDGIEFNQVTAQFVGYVYEDRRGNVWTSSESARAQGWAISRYDQQSLAKGKTTAIEIIADQAGMFFGILEATDGSIWFGSLNGAYRYDGHTFSDFKANQGQK